MSQYYSGKRSRNIYDPTDKKPFNLSRTRIDLFIQCPRCFYIDRRLGVDRPSGYPFTLNSAVDTLLKKEFDLYREKGERHPLMAQYNIDAIPAKHPMLDEWRQNFKGVQYLHKPTNLILSGAIDDLWVDSGGAYIVVDYKSTSKQEEITVLDEGWHISYKRQMEFYQWLLRRNGYSVNKTGYFLYCNGIRDADMFDQKLDFELTLIPYPGDDGWVEKTVYDAHACLNSSEIPPASDDCDYCRYREDVSSVSEKRVKS